MDIKRHVYQELLSWKENGSQLEVYVYDEEQGRYLWTWMWWEQANFRFWKV